MDITAIGSIFQQSLQSAMVKTLSAQGSDSGASSFQNMMLEMMLASNLSGAESGDASVAGGGNLMSQMLIPLLEDLLSQQVLAQSNSSEETLSGQAATSTRASLASISGQPQSQPDGAPVQGPLTQGFHPGHNGLDFGVVVGTPAKATMDGEVIYAGWNNEGYGNLVIVKNGPYQTYYAHLSEIPVEVGQQVKAGSVVGLTGNTGNSTGPHIHYEVRLNGNPIDPTRFTLA